MFYKLEILWNQKPRKSNVHGTWSAWCWKNNNNNGHFKLDGTTWCWSNGVICMDRCCCCSFDGIMLVRTFNIGGKTETFTLDVPVNKMFTLKEIIKADKLAVFHIDECSQLDIKWVWYLHLRLCQVTGQKDYPFGGVIIIFSGDFAQNANIGGDKIYNGMMRFASGNPGNLHSTIVWDACRTLAAFKTIVLDKIVRSAKDLDHCKMVTKLATGGSPSMDDIKNIKQYSQQDVEEDPSWINATWTVTTNQERLQVGYERAISWAKAHGLPLIRWRRIPMNPDDNALLLADINSDNPCLWELYVPGIIGYLRTIMNTDMKLTNGSFVIYDSLTFQSQAMSDDVMTADKMQGITLAKVVLTLAPRVQTICNFTHARFLVAFSRVRSGNDLLAIFPRNASNEIDYE